MLQKGGCTKGRFVHTGIYSNKLTHGVIEPSQVDSRVTAKKSKRLCDIIPLVLVPNLANTMVTAR
eukprot:841858-Amphidinium_carterae.2